MSGRNEVVVVLRVDKVKGYIDLSKRRVSPEDVVKGEDQFTKSKAVHSIMAHVASKLNREVEELYDAIVFPLHDKYGHAFDAFKMAILDMDKTFEGIQMDDERCARSCRPTLHDE